MQKAIVFTKSGNKYRGIFKAYYNRDGTILLEDVQQYVDSRTVHEKIFSFIVFRLKSLAYLEIDSVEIRVSLFAKDNEQEGSDVSCINIRYEDICDERTDQSDETERIVENDEDRDCPSDRSSASGKCNDDTVEEYRYVASDEASGLSPSGGAVTGLDGQESTSFRGKETYSPAIASNLEKRPYTRWDTYNYSKNTKGKKDRRYFWSRGSSPTNQNRNTQCYGDGRNISSSSDSVGVVGGNKGVSPQRYNAGKARSNFSRKAMTKARKRCRDELDSTLNTSVPQCDFDFAKTESIIEKKNNSENNADDDSNRNSFFDNF